ncbi:MAG: hypothetical protein U0840_12380 [Gemmataceae bacterium]
MANGHPDLPTTPEELAQVAADPSTPADSRDGALCALRPFIAEAAHAAARMVHADPQLRQDLLDESYAHIAARLSRFLSKEGSFQGWAYRVLHNHACDLRRRRRGLPGVGLRGDEPARPGGDEITVQELARLFSHMRADLDRYAWHSSGRVDYFAVFLFHLRHELADLDRSCSDGTLAAEVLADRATGWLPWRPAEQARRFCPGLPSLSVLWDNLTPQLGEGINYNDWLAVLNTDDSPGVSYQQLAQWVSRSRREAQNRIGAQAWHDHGFARLLSGHGREVD